VEAIEDCPGGPGWGEVELDARFDLVEDFFEA
jgi:hypothetical protein